MDLILQYLGWGAVFGTARDLLDDSLASASSITVLLVMVKGGLEMLRSVELDAVAISGNVGAMVGYGPYELMDFAFQFFTASTTLIAAQVGLLEIIEITALPILVGIGALALAIQPQAGTLFGRLGRLLMVVGLVIYFVFPAVLGAINSAYETHRMDAEISNYESFAVLSQRASDLSIRDLASSSGREDISATFGAGVQATWDSFVSILVSYTIIFVITPLAAIGISWLIIRQAMNGLDMGGGVQQVEDHVQEGYGKLRSLWRTRREMDTHQERADGADSQSGG